MRQPIKAVAEVFFQKGSFIAFDFGDFAITIEYYDRNGHYTQEGVYDIFTGGKYHLNFMPKISNGQIKPVDVIYNDFRTIETIAFKKDQMTPVESKILYHLLRRNFSQHVTCGF